MFDIYNLEGKTSLQESDVNNLEIGQYRMATVVWIATKHRALVQKRASCLRTEPGKWSPTSGSSIAGEEPIQTAIRECYEELGVTLKEDAFKLVDKVYTAKYVIYVFVAYQDVDINSLKLQESEVSDVALMTISQIEKCMRKGTFFCNVAGWENVLEELKNKIIYK